MGFPTHNRHQNDSVSPRRSTQLHNFARRSTHHQQQDPSLLTRFGNFTEWCQWLIALDINAICSHYFKLLVWFLMCLLVISSITWFCFYPWIDRMMGLPTPSLVQAVIDSSPLMRDTSKPQQGLIDSLKDCSGWEKNDDAANNDHHQLAKNVVSIGGFRLSRRQDAHPLEEIPNSCHFLGLIRFALNLGNEFHQLLASVWTNLAVAFAVWSMMLVGCFVIYWIVKKIHSAIKL